MYRFIIFTIQLLLLIIIVTFIFTNPFKISLDIGNLKYSFSSNFFAILIIIFTLLLYLSFYIFFKSRLSINNYLIKNKFKKLEKGYQYFVDAMIAISNKDNRNAIKAHKNMTNYLKDDPSLSLLLKSEVFKIENKQDKLLEVYDLMLTSKKTETIGYRGLMELNIKNQDYHHAFLYGEKLFNLNPNIEKLFETLAYIAAKTKNWNQLILISDKAYSKKIISREIYQENKSIAYYEIANIKSESNLKDAIKNIIRALELKNNFPPFIKLHLELVAKLNNISLLKKLIKKYWLGNPSQYIRLIITKIISDNKLDDLLFINNIIKNNSDNNESKKMLVHFAIKNQQWNIARLNISGLIGANPSAEVCLFMSDIELGEHNDKQKSDSWIMRSEISSQHSQWICKITNQSQDDWASISNSGYFNSLILTNSKMLDKNRYYNAS